MDLYSEQQAALAAQVAEGEARIAVRLEEALAEIAAARAVPTRRTERAGGRGLLIAAGCVAVLSGVGIGAALLAGGGLPSSWSQDGGAPAAVAAHVDRSLRSTLKVASAALTARTPAPLPVAKAPPAGATSDAYPAITAALERGDATALPWLVSLAQGGDARAQLYLAGLYEAGAPGVPRDLSAARAWTRRAAEAGDRVAMYNLALFLIDAGGTDAEAAGWFRRAAERGVVDAQYNLGLLYAAGRGVERNQREAYRWFSVAANAGDVAAREKQVELESRLQPAERSGLDRDAAGFRPGAAPSPPDPAPIIPPAETLAETQALLARKGYYVGPVDGVASPGLRTAAAAYLRDHPR
jgi:localization factor PodJL